MKGLAEDPKSDAERRLFNLTLQQVLDDLYQPAPVLPGGASLSGGTADDNGYDVAAIDFPNGVTSQAKKNYRILPRWVRGGVYLRVLYSSSGASTASFSFSTILRFWTPGDNLTGGTVTGLSVTHALPGPAAADDLLTFEYAAPAVLIPANKTYLTWVLVRHDPDANANPFKLISFEWKVLGI